MSEPQDSETYESALKTKSEPSKTSGPVRSDFRCKCGEPLWVERREQKDRHKVVDLRLWHVCYACGEEYIEEKSIRAARFLPQFTRGEMI